MNKLSNEDILKNILDNLKKKECLVYTDEMLKQFDIIDRESNRFIVTEEVLNQIFNYKSD